MLSLAFLGSSSMASTQEKKLIFALFFSIIFLHFILLLLSQQAADNTSGHSPSGSLNRPLSFFRSLFLSARSVVFAIRGLINSPSHCVLKRNFSFGFAQVFFFFDVQCFLKTGTDKYVSV